MEVVVGIATLEETTVDIQDHLMEAIEEEIMAVVVMEVVVMVEIMADRLQPVMLTIVPKQKEILIIQFSLETSPLIAHLAILKIFLKRIFL